MTRKQAIYWLRATLDDTLVEDDERDLQRREAVMMAIESLMEGERDGKPE